MLRCGSLGGEGECDGIVMLPSLWPIFAEWAAVRALVVLGVVGVVHGCGGISGVDAWRARLERKVAAPGVTELGVCLLVCAVCGDVRAVVVPVVVVEGVVLACERVTGVFEMDSVVVVIHDDRVFDPSVSLE